MNVKTTLTLHEVETILRTTAENYRPSGWLTVSDSKLLLTAIHHDAEQVYLTGMGRYFDIRYKYGKVWVSPTRDAFAPCGWFTPSVLQKELDQLVGIRS